MKKNYKTLVLTACFIGSLSFSYSQQKTNKSWMKIENSNRTTKNKVFRKTEPKNFLVYQLNLKDLKNKLTNSNSGIVVKFPNEKGELKRFKVYEASILANELQKKHPTIKSYAGQGVDDPTATIRFSISKLGLHAMVLSGKKPALFIDPFVKDGSEYIVYSKNELPILQAMQCLVDEKGMEVKEKDEFLSKNENANDGKKRTFRLALAATGEYSQFHLTNQGVGAGETEAVKKAAVLAAMNATMTRVNGIFERDLAITMEIVANNTDIIYLDGATDPFTNNNASALISESQTVIDNIINPVNYDIGHTFSTGGGGLAQLNSPCTLSKAKGITGSPSPIGDSYDIDYVAHEMGHQFGANHTFNGSAGSCAGGNRNDSTAVEPGSGSTIMAYAGICSPENVQSNGDSYFHIISIQEMWNNISSGNSTCGTQTNTSNNVPNVSAGDDYTIPKSTPFVLTGSGSDSDGDTITYCWEQTDTEIVAVPLVSTEVDGPAFRSLSPTTSEKRYFPNFQTVLSGDVANTWEVVPSVSRTMNFALTVRDNNLNGGQTATDEMIVTVNDTTGPFEVTSQNSSGVTWQSGTAETITWDVNNTNTLLGASNVNILLSTDGGLTYSTTLKSNTPNDGGEVITVPNIPAPYCRIMIVPTNNIFYSINNISFAIDYSITTNCITYEDLNTNLNITDGNTSGYFDSSSINVPDNVTISDVDVYVNIDHNKISQLQVGVFSAEGTLVNLIYASCGSNGGMDVTFDDDGSPLTCASGSSTLTGTFVPLEPLSILNDENSAGNWHIGVYDSQVGNTGTLNSWQIEICSSIETPLAINDFEFELFNLFPNPTNGNVTISLVSKITSENINISLYDMVGRLISTKKFQQKKSNFSEEIDFGEIASGTYILRVNKGNKRTVKQLIIY